MNYFHFTSRQKFPTCACAYITRECYEVAKKVLDIVLEVCHRYPRYLRRYTGFLRISTPALCASDWSPTRKLL